MDLPEQLVDLYKWFCSEQETAANCETRDVFAGRLSSFMTFSEKTSVPEDGVALLTAVIGEIGNNCFDHNLGQWKDVTGANFIWGWNSVGFLWAAISDRGQGLLNSLIRVQPNLASSQEAIDFAFHQRISSRSNERRGNGLKFVRESVNKQSGRGIYFQTNGANHEFGDFCDFARALKLNGGLKSDQGPHGTFSLIMWKA